MTKTLSTRSQSIYDYIARRESFKTYGSLRGERTSYADSMGYLPSEYVAKLQNDETKGYLSYIVYSYNTPIAWHSLKDGWHIPDTSYSVTTSKHQNRVRVAMSFSGYSYSE